METNYGFAPRSEADWSARLWVYPGLAILATLPYLLSGALYSEFVFDDIKLVKENAAIRDLGAALRLESFDITSERWKDETVRVNSYHHQSVKDVATFAVRLDCLGLPKQGASVNGSAALLQGEGLSCSGGYALLKVFAPICIVNRLFSMDERGLDQRLTQKNPASLIRADSSGCPILQSFCRHQSRFQL